MSDPIVLTSGDDGRLDLGFVDAQGPTLLPKSFTRRLPGEPKPGDPVALGDLEAYRYVGLKPKGADAPLTVYTVPTTAGVATVVCSAGAQGAAQPLEDCESVATTLELTGARSFPVGPSDDYAAALGDVFDKLASDTREPQAALDDADTAGAQGAAADRLASAYTEAGGALNDTQVSPADADAHGEIIAAVNSITGAYRRLADAARAGDSGGYASATDAVERAGRGLTRALGSLEELGYSGG
jgi:hypothetical protein